MIRILVIDDSEIPDSLAELTREIEGSYHTAVEIRHLNPVPFFEGKDEDAENTAFLSEIKNNAAEFWDILIVDLNLNDVELEEKERLELPLAIVETFHSNNQSAMKIFYSGTLAKHIPKLIADDNKSTKQDAERMLRRIFLAGVIGFVPRDEIGSFVFSLLDQPPWILVVDRILTLHSDLMVAVEESKYKGMSFANLACAIRKQDDMGKKLAKQIAEFGVASLVDLNK